MNRALDGNRNTRPMAGASATQAPRPTAAPATAAPQQGGGSAAAPAGGSSRTGTALLVGVFLLSAAVGGGMAGLYLAMQKNGGGSGTSQVADARQGGDAAVVQVPASGTAPAVAVKKKDEERLPGMASAPKAGGSTSAERGQASATAPAPAPAAAPAVAEAPPAAAKSAPQGEPVQAATAELKALTENVVAALGALNAAPEEKDIAEVEADAERLRNSLADLVNAALTQGKSEAEVRELIAAALEDAGEGNIPGILRDASGKLNLQKLLASIMPQDAARDMPMSAQERAYFEQLEEEADNDVAAAPAKPAGNAAKPARERKPKGRFFYENGKRYTIVRRGDTLSDIAYAAYGDVLAYPAILRANRGRISTRRLKPGTRIVVPELPRKTRRARSKKRSAAPVSLIRRAATARKATQEQLLARKRAAPAPQQTTPAETAVPAGAKNVITNFRPARLQPDIIVPQPAGQ